MDKERSCIDCSEHIEDGEPFVNFEREIFCTDCALKRGIMGPLEWLDIRGISIYHHAEYHDGKITAYQKWGKGYRKDELELFR